MDAGDFADFKRLELQGTDGLAAIELLEYVGYDAIAIGNNETFNGYDTLVNMATKSKVPFLSCNLNKLGNTEIEGVKKSIIIHKNNLRILIIGTSPNLGPFNGLLGFDIKDHLESIKKEIMLNKDKYDLCVVLSHSGISKDREIAEIDEVNVIIGGHTHLLMDKPEIINNTIIHTSGGFGEHLGLLKIEINNSKVELLEDKNIRIEECPNHEKIIDILKENKEKAIVSLSKNLYNIDVDLWHDVVEENPITNLLADALVDIFKTDIGLINSGVINGGIRVGGVSRKKLIEICNSPLNPTYFELQGKDLKEALQNSLDSEFCFMDGRGPGFRGKYLGRLHVSNALSEHDGRRISNIIINGEDLLDTRWYSVASSDYLQRGTGYASLKNNRNVRYNSEYLRDTLREYLCKKGFIERTFRDRWITLDEVYLVTPSMEHKESYKEMILEFEKAEDSIYPGAIRPRGMDYKDWLKNLETYRSSETCPSHLAPSDTYFLVNKYNRIFGAISIRHCLNEELLKFGGHIGYGIIPSERRKGYAKSMLKMALENCKSRNMKQVLITCNKVNIASAKTIIANGGVLENELMEEDGNLVQRYWVEL
ncbi:GNAT family N-acetyltransferase [Clostridium estertheticum]|nr:GNAT family N-acetyltransferase [Clostridium estertheticum]MBZ9685861.1 GNAT family N-acetyltransferase [Clostridium estertheticum]